jgi:hypothetical protein
MTMCPDCQSLLGAFRSGPPHAHLIKLEDQPFTQFERYRCGACAAAWTRDGHAKETVAMWESSKD